ncbi:hypothetical protein [Nostoc sp. FACHB-190]|uniref:hypothetical protein n=1 Tax=Nostoc sp. FACHB-190 TaxID=2692838 RepID=UPI001689C4D0|nr:hypothetical protein [Nostoc sp. FACHB-190]MBD2299420.1 hypothetical protein [Nostoc sp. FACHB-190]
MLNETTIQQAARDIQQLIPDLNTWELSVARIKSEESQVFSWVVELTEHLVTRVYPFRYIRVTFDMDTYQNISLVSLDYGLMFQQSGKFSVEAVLDGRTFNNHTESTSSTFPPSDVEAKINLISLAYEFISKLIQTLTSPNHPESISNLG